MYLLFYFTVLYRTRSQYYKNIAMANLNLIVIFILFSLTLSQQDVIHQLKITSKQPSSHCQLRIHNNQELLDFSTNCPLTQANSPQLLQFINITKAYFFIKKEVSHYGYRYFKNQLHYNYQPQTITNYQQIITNILGQSQLGQVQLPLEDTYNLTLQLLPSFTWRVTQIHVHYLLTHILNQHLSFPNFDIELGHSNATLTPRGSKNIAIRKLQGQGLHQQINITFQLTSQTDYHIDPNTCSFIVTQILPESTYIDADQLRTITKFEIINVQKPEPLSKQYFYTYVHSFKDIQQVGVRKYNFLYPIHFRYPKPSHLNYTSVILHPSDQILISCRNGSQIFKISEDPFSDRGRARIFTGPAHDAKIVSMVTFIIMLIVAMYITKQLRKE